MWFELVFSELGQAEQARQAVDKQPCATDLADKTVDKAWTRQITQGSRARPTWRTRQDKADQARPRHDPPSFTSTTDFFFCWERTPKQYINCLGKKVILISNDDLNKPTGFQEWWPIISLLYRLLSSEMNQRPALKGTAPPTSGLVRQSCARLFLPTTTAKPSTPTLGNEASQPTLSAASTKPSTQSTSDMKPSPALPVFESHESYCWRIHRCSHHLIAQLHCSSIPGTCHRYQHGWGQIHQHKPALRRSLTHHLRWWWKSY